MKSHILDYLRKQKNKTLSNWLDRRIIHNPAFRASLHARLMDEQLKSDPDFQVGRVASGFAPHLSEMNNDDEVLKRICRSYKLAKAKQATLGPEYRESNEWAPIYRSALKSVMAALETEDIESLGRMYRNFWRDPCSLGLVGLPVDMEATYFGEIIKEKDAKDALRDSFWRINLWRELVSDHPISVLESPEIGNPYGFYVGNTFLKGGCDYQHYYSTQIRRLLDLQRHNTVAEIGGGYGGMAYYLLRDVEGICYLDFDLPENMALTSYYLLHAFPEKTIFLYGEATPSEMASAEFDAMILPSFMLAEQPARSIDVMFNSYSLAEMSPETIQKLVNECSRTVGGHILHVNHNKNSVVKADDFGIDKAGFSLLYKVRALWNYARNPQCDEFEYLYVRRCSEG